MPYDTSSLTVAALLRKRRKASGMTQGQLAEAINEQQSFVSRCENGQQQITFVDLDKMLRAMGCTLTEFVAEYEGTNDEKMS